MKRKEKEILCPAPQLPTRNKRLEETVQACRTAFRGGRPEEAVVPVNATRRLPLFWPATIAVAGMTTLVFLAVVFFLSEPVREQHTVVSEEICHERVVRELETTFRNDLKSVIFDDGDFSFELGETYPGHDGVMIAVELQLDGRSVMAIIRPGVSVVIPLDGKEVTFEALPSPGHGYLLVGNDFLWSPDTASLPAGMSVVSVKTMEVLL